jgi:multidrug efflux pump subunit AcrA (membrane-fusion protein)
MNEWVRRSSPKQRAIAIAAALVVAGVSIYAYAHTAKKTPTQATFQVKRGEFLDVVEFRGELKALKSVSITGPANAWDLQIVKIATDGSQVKQGDVVVQFDPSRLEQTLAQNRSVLKSAQAEIDQVKAQNLLTDEADTTAVMKAKYDVEAAKLEASKAEIVSAIEGEEARLAVINAEQALRQAEAQLKSDRAVAASTVESKKQASAKARYDMERAATALESMTLKAPSNGMISLLPVWHNGNETPFKVGERAWSGAPIAQLPDVSSLRVAARVDETERGRLSLVQPVSLQLDAIADRQFTGKVERIGTIATSDLQSGWPFPHNFDLEIAIDQTDARFRPGMTTQVTVILDRVPNAITIPVQASFLKSGRTVAYVWNGSRFDERLIQIERRSRDRLLISSGLKADDLVALKDPTGKE